MTQCQKKLSPSDCPVRSERRESAIPAFVDMQTEGASKMDGIKAIMLCVRPCYETMSHIPRVLGFRGLCHS